MDLQGFELKEIQDKHYRIYKERRKLKLYVNLNKRKTSTIQKSKFIPIEEQLKVTKKKLKQKRYELTDYFTEQYNGKELDTINKIKKRVENSKTIKQIKKALKWLKKHRKKNKKDLKNNKKELNNAVKQLEAVKAKINLKKRNKKKIVFDYQADIYETEYENAIKILGADGSAPGNRPFNFKPERDSASKAVRWIKVRYDKLFGRREQLEKDSFRLYQKYISEDRRLGVLSRDFMMRRLAASQAVCIELNKLNPKLYAQMLDPLSKYMDDLKYTIAVFENFGQKDIKDMLDSKSKKEHFGKAAIKGFAGLIEKFKAYEGLQERIEIAGKVLKPFKTHAGNVKKVLEFMDKYERNDPQMVMDALKVSSAIAGMLPLSSHPVGKAIDFYAEVGASIIKAGNKIATDKMIKARKAARKQGHRQTPERMLYTRDMVESAIYFKHYAMSSEDIDKITTDFQARRILHLLQTKILNQMGDQY